MKDPAHQAAAYQRELFERLDEFFRRATGRAVHDFATFESFSEIIHKEAHDLGARAEIAFSWADRELRSFYARESIDAFSAARQIGGLKLVLGGSQRFLRTQLNSVSSSLLYADTVLVPDPVMPWLETERREERFRHVLLLQSVFAVLHLKPLVDAELAYPAVLVFPSWEKLLEEHDNQTQEGIFRLVTDVFARFVDPGISSLEDLNELVRRDPRQFVDAVERHRLFVAPGGSLDEDWRSALKRYEEHLKTWRAQQWMEEYRKLPIPFRLINAIVERFGPQYHLLENSEELNSHPLLCIEQQAHYYKLVSQTNTARLVHLRLLQEHTQALVDGFGSKRLTWLSRVPMTALVELRKNNENAAFRARLEAVVKRMHDSAIGDIDRVAAEIHQELSSAIADHERDVKAIQKKYNRVHGQTAVAAWAAAGAALVPSLAPFLGAAAPLAIGAKYACDKLEERAARSELARSMMGVIASLNEHS